MGKNKKKEIFLEVTMVKHKALCPLIDIGRIEKHLLVCFDTWNWIVTNSTRNASKIWGYSG